MLLSVKRKCLAVADIWGTEEIFQDISGIALNCVLAAVGISQLQTVLMTSLQTSVVSFGAESGKGEQILATLWCK